MDVLFEGDVEVVRMSTTSHPPKDLVQYELKGLKHPRTLLRVEVVADTEESTFKGEVHRVVVGSAEELHASDFITGTAAFLQDDPVGNNVVIVRPTMMKYPVHREVLLLDEEYRHREKYRVEIYWIGPHPPKHLAMCRKLARTVNTPYVPSPPSSPAALANFTDEFVDDEALWTDLAGCRLPLYRFTFENGLGELNTITERRSNDWEDLKFPIEHSGGLSWSARNFTEFTAKC